MRSIVLTALLVAVSFYAFSQVGWTRLQNFGGAARANGSAFSLDTDGDRVVDKGFYTCGWNMVSTDFNDLWSYDPVTNNWTQMASMPGIARRQTASFVINNIAYVGTGAYTLTAGNYLNDFYAYDPMSNSWDTIASVPGPVRWGAFGFSVGGKGYIAMGSQASGSGSSNLTSVYEYDPQTDTWTQKADFPGPSRRAGTAFSIDMDGDGINDRAYILYGSRNSSTIMNELWEYVQATDTWVQRTVGTPQGLNGPVSLGLEGRAFVGMGGTLAGVYSNQFRYYDPITDSWTLETLFPDTLTHGSSAFALNGAFHFVGGTTFSLVPVKYSYKYVPLADYATVCGNVFMDADLDCNITSGDMGLENYIVKAEPGPFYGLTDSAGNYCIRVDTGSYEISELIPVHLSGLVDPFCPANNILNVHAPAYGDTISGQNIGNEIDPCPLLSVNILTGVRRWCFPSQFSQIFYCNYGLVDADDVEITLSPSEYSTISSASIPYLADTATGNIIFSLGQVPAGFCGSITVFEQMTCDQDHLGLTACSEVQITSTTPGCDTIAPGQAEIEVSVYCSGGDRVTVEIVNVGPGDMIDSTALQVFVDSTLRFEGQVKLDSGEVYTFSFGASGQTVTVIADQVPGVPGAVVELDWAEACGAPLVSPVSTGFVINYAGSGTSLVEDVDCKPIVASFDPNDKLVSPSGVGEEHLVKPGTELTYTIRFQNTGTDTAFTVMIVDTLSEHFDLASLRIIGASHNYEVQLTGQQKPVLKFIFNHILLPDSNVNEPLSHGYIVFKITPDAGTPLETVISNFASIYFDFNPPVLTEPVSITLSNRVPADVDGVIVNGELILDLTGVEQVLKPVLSVVPNPNNGRFILNLGTGISGETEVSVYTLAGQVVVAKTIYLSGEAFIHLNNNALLQGAYLVRVKHAGHTSVARFVVNK